MTEDEIAVIERDHARVAAGVPSIWPDAVALAYIPVLLTEVRRLRAIETAAEAHRVAYLAWHHWRPCAGMGHGHADRYAETRDALWAALATGGPRAAQETREE